MTTGLTTKSSLLWTRADGIITSPNQVVVTIVDQDLAPIVKFDRSDVLLTEDSDTTVAIDVHAGSSTARIPPGLDSAAAPDPFRTLVLSVSNPSVLRVAATGADARCPGPTDEDFG